MFNATHSRSRVLARICLGLTTLAWTSISLAQVTRYVNPAHSAAQDGGDGNAAAPFKTLSFAMTRMLVGDTLLIHSGTYRETLDLRKATALLSTSTTPTAVTKIAAVAGATVLLKGSDVVQGWEWIRPNVFVRRNWTVNSQQVFVDGVPLKQLGGSIYGGFPDKPGNSYAHILASSGGIWPGRINGNIDSVVDAAFYYDAAAQILYVKGPWSTLQDRTVEVSTRSYAIFGSDLHDLSLSSLQVAHSNTSATMQNGAVTLYGSRLVLDRIDVKYADGAGFDITGNNNVLRNSSASLCGQIGIKMRGHYAQLLNSTMTYNNTRGFNKWWEAGGAKFVGDGGLKSSTVAGNRAYFNAGDGLWFDTNNSNNKIRDNSIAYNSGMGIHYEASQTGTVFRNIIFGNGQRGIYLPNSMNSVVHNNLIVGNALEGIAIVDVRGATAQNDLALTPAGNYVAANVLGWNGKSAIVLPGEGVRAEADANLFLGATVPSFALGWPTPTNPALDLPAWRATNHDLHSWHVQMAMPTSLAAQIQQQATSPNFSAVTAIATGYSVPLSALPRPVPVGIGSKPGP